MRDAAGHERHREAAFVEEAMVEAAQENQVVEAGGAAVHPVADVMRVDEALV